MTFLLQRSLGTGARAIRPVALVAMASLSACSVPLVQPPVPSVPLAATFAQGGPVPAAGETLDGAWWAGYGDPTLTALVAAAEEPGGRHPPRHLRQAHLSPAARRRRLGGAASSVGPGHHGAGLRHRRRRHAEGAAAVLPNRIAARAAGRAATARGRVIRRHRAAGEAARSAAGEGPGHRVLHRLHRCRHAALLSVDPAGIAQPRVRPVRRQDGGD